jgi:hypothetical protein
LAPLRAGALAACMWKTRIFTVFSRSNLKNPRFSSVFCGFSLAFSKSLGYSAQRPGFFGVSKGRESAAVLDHLEVHEKSGG